MFGFEQVGDPFDDGDPFADTAAMTDRAAVSHRASVSSLSSETSTLRPNSFLAVPDNKSVLSASTSDSTTKAGYVKCEPGGIGSTFE